MGDSLATIDMGRKAGGAAVGAGSPLGLHLTMWPGTRPTSLPSGILIRPTVLPNATLLRVGILLRTIFIPSLVVKTFTVRVH